MKVLEEKNIKATSSWDEIECAQLEKEGNVARVQRDFNLAIEKYSESYKKRLMKTDMGFVSIGLVMCEKLLGELYFQADMPQKALKYYQKAEEHVKMINAGDSQGDGYYLNISTLYISMAKFYLDQKKYKSALNSIKAASSALDKIEFRDIDYLNNESITFECLSQYYKQNKEYDESIYYAKLCINTRTAIYEKDNSYKFFQNLIAAFDVVARLLFDSGDVKQGKEYSLKPLHYGMITMIRN